MLIFFKIKLYHAFYWLFNLFILKLLIQLSYVREISTRASFESRPEKNMILKDFKIDPDLIIFFLARNYFYVNFLFM